MHISLVKSLLIFVNYRRHTIMHENLFSLNCMHLLHAQNYMHFLRKDLQYTCISIWYMRYVPFPGCFCIKCEK